jgi:serine/threonine protein kinase
MANELETMSTLGPVTVLSGRYRLGRKLGGGGMKVVYLAEDLRLNNRLCAVAEMIDNFANPEEQQQAISGFQREADILARLKDEHIVQIFDRFSEQQNHYLVMEYVEGGTLQDLIVRSPGGMPQLQAIDIAAQILETLEYLHGLVPPIIYRDMKPANVMVTPAGKVKLIDFGIARFFQNATMTTFGTPGYAPKEQYGGKVEARSDLYSLGATLHHMLTGRAPIPFDFPVLTSLRPDCDRNLSILVAQALADKIEERVPSAREFRLRLEAIKADIESGRASASAASAVLDSTQPLQTMSTSGIQSAVTNPQSQSIPVSDQDATTPMRSQNVRSGDGTWLFKEEQRASEALTRPAKREAPVRRTSTRKARRIFVAAVAVSVVAVAAAAAYSYWRNQQDEMARLQYMIQHQPTPVAFQPTPAPVQPQPTTVQPAEVTVPEHHHVRHYHRPHHYYQPPNYQPPNYQPPPEEARNPYSREAGSEPYPYQQPTPAQSQGSSISGIESGAVAGVVGGVIGGVVSGLLNGSGGSSNSPAPRRYYPRRTH